MTEWCPMGGEVPTLATYSGANRVVVDWDGTCVVSAWPAMGDWLPGAREALRELLEAGYDVVVFSTRLAPTELDEETSRGDGEQDAEVAKVEGMLTAAGLGDVAVWTKPWKPGALACIDDKAVAFNGDWPRVVQSFIAPEPDDRKPTNPKDLIGADKLPLHLWPATATALGCLGLLDGALKYGRANWRAAGVRASIYLDALERHVKAWSEGEDVDPDSGLPHLAHALACLAIVVDAGAAGKLVDDRQYRGAGYRALVTELTPHVARLKEKHAERDPKHYTIADAA